MEWWEESPIASAPKGRERVNEFISTYRPLAERVGSEIGVSPDILLAKFGSETGWGKSVIPGTNNLGNIKDPSGRGVFATDNMTKSRDAYRVFETPEAFGDYYTAFIKRAYPKAVGAGNDPMAFAQGLKEGVRGSYAEDPEYGPKIARATTMITGGTAPSKANSWWEAAPMADAPKEDTGWWAAAPLADAPAPAAPTQAVQSAAPQAAPQPATAKAPAPAQTAPQRSAASSFGLGTRNVLEGVEQAFTYPVRAVGEAASGIAGLFGNKELADTISRTVGMKNKGAGALVADAAGLAKPETKTEKVIAEGTKAAAGLLSGTGIAKLTEKGPEALKAAAGILMPGTSGTAGQVAKDVGIFGTLGASMEAAPAETAAGLALLAGGKAAAGKVIAPRVADALDNRAANKLLDASGAGNVRQDAEILRRASQEFNNPLRAAGGVQKTLTTKDLNGKIEQSFLREADDLVSQLPKDFESKGILKTAITRGTKNSVDEIAALRNVKGGEQVADLIEAAQRTSVVTGNVAAKGGLVGNIVRESIDRAPAAILTGVFGGVPIPVKMGTTGVGQRLLGRQSREEVTQKAIDKLSRGANKIEQKYGLAPSKVAAEELGGIVKQADNDFLGRVMGIKRDQLSTKRIADEAAAKAAAEKEAAKLLKAQEGQMISEGGRILADKKAAEKAALAAGKVSTKSPKKGPLDNFMQKAMSDSDEQLLKVREFQQLGDNPKDIVGLAAKATPAPASVDELPISDIIRKVSLETDAAFIPNGKTYVGNEVKNILNAGKTTKAATSAQKAVAKAEAKVADKEAKALAEKAKVDSFLSGELPGNLSTEAGGFQSTLKYVNGTADEISAGLRQLAKERPDLAPNIVDMFVPGKKAKNLYEIQNNLFKTLGKREQPAALSQAGGALTPETSRVFNQASYEATVRTAEAARDAAIKSAPSPTLKQFAIDVANEKSPALKTEKLQERLKAATDPEEIGFLLNMVEPLTKFGKKAKK